MADRKDSFSLDGLFGGNFWDGVDTNVKRNVIDAVVGVLGDAGALTEAQAGLLRAQRDKAVLDTENGKLRQAGVRPGQYLSQRQRREILHPEDEATRLQRLQFHGGMANGKWTNNYDEWLEASVNGHGTDSNGKEISTKSFGFSVPVSGPSKQDREAFERNRSVNSAWARSSSRLAGGDRRGVRLDSDGSMEIHFGDTGVKTDISAGRSGTSLAARRRMEMLTNTDPSNGPWMFDSPEPSAPRPARSPGWVTRPVNAARDFLGGLFSASKGSETMRGRGWLDAVFAKAERAAMRGGRTRR